jgi:hypothetical protein
MNAQHLAGHSHFGQDASKHGKEPQAHFHPRD